MSKKTEKDIEHAELFDQCVDHIGKLYAQHEDRFMRALEDSEKRTVTLSFVCTLDMSDNAPVVTTALRFKDKTTEAGMDVVKSFTAKDRAKLDDPAQPRLPIENGSTEHEAGTVAAGVVEKAKGRGRKKGGGKEAAARNDD